MAERETLAEEETRGDLLALLDTDEHCETEAVTDAEWDNELDGDGVSSHVDSLVIMAVFVGIIDGVIERVAERETLGLPVIDGDDEAKPSVIVTLREASEERDSVPSVDSLRDIRGDGEDVADTEVLAEMREDREGVLVTDGLLEAPADRDDDPDIEELRDCVGDVDTDFDASGEGEEDRDERPEDEVDEDSDDMVEAEGDAEGDSEGRVLGDPLTVDEETAVPETERVAPADTDDDAVGDAIADGVADGLVLELMVPLAEAKAGVEECSGERVPREELLLLIVGEIDCVNDSDNDVVVVTVRVAAVLVDGSTLPLADPESQKDSVWLMVAVREVARDGDNDGDGDICAVEDGLSVSTDGDGERDSRAEGETEPLVE